MSKMILILNGLLASGKTYLGNQVASRFTIIDEDEAKVKESLSHAEDPITLEQQFSLLQLEKLRRLVDAYLQQPNKPIIYISSVYYTTNIYWKRLWTPRYLERCLMMDREIRAFRSIEQVLLALMGPCHEIRLCPPAELILTQYKLRQRENEWCPDLAYINQLKSLELSVFLPPRHTILTTNDISADRLMVMTRLGQDEIIGPGLNVFTDDEYMEYFHDVNLILNHLELQNRCLKFWGMKTLADTIYAVLLILPVTIIQDVARLEELFLSFLAKSLQSPLVTLDIFSQLAEPPLAVHHKYIKKADEKIFVTCTLTQSEKYVDHYFADLTSLLGCDITVIHIMFEGGVFSGAKQEPTATVTVKNASSRSVYLHTFYQMAWAPLQS